MTEKTFIKGLRVLEAMARSAKPTGVAELAAQLKLGNSNVHRLLTTLVDEGYARRRADMAKYELTMKLWEFRNLPISGIESEELALEDLTRLSQLTNETVYVSILDGVETVFIHQLESNHAVQARVVSRQPAYASATGKAILAFQDVHVIEQVAATLKKLTPMTVDSKARLLEELAEIRERGYATNIGEAREDVNGVAAPIRNSVGGVVSAVGVSGPANRLTINKLEEISDDVVGVGEALSYKLGYRPA